MTADPSPRTNRTGHPCPSWCETDHETPQGDTGWTYEFHGGPVTRIKVPGTIGSWPDEVRTRPVHDGRSDDAPFILVSGTRNGASGPDPNAWVSLRDARDLVAVIDMLAGATPDQHRELAAAIRTAAGIAEASNG